MRHYRTWFRPEGDLCAFRVVYRETDLAVLAERDLSLEVLQLVQEIRAPLEEYLKEHPEFLSSLKPLPEDPGAPEIVKRMLAAGRAVGVGPMAAVAGAIAEAVGRRLLAEGLTRKVVVENGGDIFLALGRAATVALYAGDSPLSGKVGLRIAPDFQPCGVCTSSGKIGHSLSLGQAEAVTVIAPEAALADAAATALGNLAKGKKSLRRILSAARDLPGLLGVVCILGKDLGAVGPAVELVPL
ncbi:UPF0280 family protein [Thermosulfurimonas marina]|uniref:UPF0280 family protein n=1 Tax=Thermosulfurimonas marina TaxID=2047767 RepID=A0A6H1WUY2_9BACT|nr:UPF0280 family protein [Thermosulfurimonas marina]